MYKRIFAIYAAIFILIILTGCPKRLPTHKYTGIEFCAADTSTTVRPGVLYYKPVDTIKNNLIFFVSYNAEHSSFANNFTLANSAYAMTKKRIFSNPIDRETFSLAFDHDFLFKGAVIPANTNVLSIPEIKKEVSIGDVPWTYLISSSSDKIEFSSLLRNNSKFINKTYWVKFQCSTALNEMFSDSTKVYFSY